MDNKKREGRKRQRSPNRPENRGQLQPKLKATTTAEDIWSAEEQLAVTIEKLEKARGKEEELLLELQLAQQKELVLLRQRQLCEMQTYELQAMTWWQWIKSLVGFPPDDATSENLDVDVITPQELLRVRAASFALISNTTTFNGIPGPKQERTGFFISPRIAVMALHDLLFTEGHTFGARFPGKTLGTSRHIAVHVVKEVPELDLAFLETYNDQPFVCLSELNPALLPQLKVGLAYFNFSPENSQLGTVRVLAGTILDVDEEAGTVEHSCYCVPENSGPALIVAQGQVVAMHTDGGNRLNKLLKTASHSDIRRHFTKIECSFLMHMGIHNNGF